MRIAAVQMVSGPSVSDNLARAAHWIAEAAKAGAQLVALPEYFCLLSPKDNAKCEIAEPFGTGPLQSFLAETAKKHNIYLVGGSIPLQTATPQRVRNSTLVFDPTGECLSRYDKIHLFQFDNGRERYDEAQSIEAGEQVTRFRAPCGDVGLAICYDLRFPELFRQLGDINLLIIPAAFTWQTGQAHWEVLLRARAIENQCYVLASAQGGTHPHGRRTWGHSILIDPWGEIVACHPEGEGLAVGELNMQRLQAVRQQLPARQHCRL